MPMGLSLRGTFSEGDWQISIEADRLSFHTCIPRLVETLSPITAEGLTGFGGKVRVIALMDV
jgi:hypothetical protein